MRRADLEVGALYAGSDKRCYEIVDLTPGWRIGFDRNWVRDDSTRLRTMHGKKVPFRKNNALRAVVHVDGMTHKAVILPSRLLRRWDESLVVNAAKDTERANVALKEAARLAHLFRADRKMNDFTVLDDGQSVRITTEDLCTLLAIIPEVNRDLNLFPDEGTIES